MRKTVTFGRSGVHPEERKHTAALPIEVAPLPQKVVILLSQHTGAPCQPLVRAKEEVKRGQTIGEAEAYVSSPVHATVSGKVVKVEQVLGPNGFPVMAVTIESDGEDRPYDDPLGAGPYPIDPEDRDRALSAIRKAGIVGLGGATFPTHVKLRPPPNKAVDVLLVNGAECEPYLTSDHRLMVERTDEVVEGVGLLMRLLGVGRAVVGIEDNKADAIDALERARGTVKGLEVVACRTRYPQGGERQLIYAALGRRVPPGKLPFDVGVVVQNVATVSAIRRALVLGEPLLDRVVTLSGEGMRRQGNVQFRVGTLFSEALAHVGGIRDETIRVVMGGPMMGKAVPHLDVPITKATGGILALTEREVARFEERACLRCGRCVDACPQGLVPTTLAALAEARRFDEFAKCFGMDCVECGSCNFICPSRRRLVHWIRVGKFELNDARRKAARKEAKAP